VFDEENMKQIIIATVILLLASTKAWTDPYIGASVGSAAYDVDLSAFNTGSFDDSSTGTKLYGGYSFNKYFAAEAGFYNFAEASAGAIESAPDSGEFHSGDASVDGIAVYAVGNWPLNKDATLMAKLGALNWDADLTVDDTSGSNDGTDVAFSIGASYAFTKEVHGVLEWEYFDTDNPELSMFSAGFRFVFR
jgi:OOP family OmpA-OmpF porin